MYKANCGNNIRRKGNSNIYKYRCEANVVPTGARPWAVTHFAATGAGHLSVHIIQLENHWMDLDEIWYECYDIGDYPKIVLLNFRSVITTQRTNKVVRWIDTSATCNRAIQ
jgi:hypothetical protein